MSSAYHTAWQRALRDLAKRHPDEFDELFHVEKHRLAVGHRHGPDDPETIDWWGEPDKAAA